MMEIGKGAIAILMICAGLCLGPDEFVGARVVSECQSSSDCPPGRCCVLGGSRFSVPRCEVFGEEGESCRPVDSMSTLNTTLTYPDGSVLQLQDVYFTLCPCAAGLSCESGKSLCRKAN